jgi:enterochelin esterase family protein
MLALLAMVSTMRLFAEPLSPLELRKRLAAGAVTSVTAPELEKYFGKAEEGSLRVDGVNIAWGVRRSGAKQVSARFLDNSGEFELKKVDGTDWFVGSFTVPHGTGTLWTIQADGKLIGDARQIEAYLPDPDTQAHDNVPKGKLIQMPKWSSKVYDGTTRDWWVYVPAQYKADVPATTMIFNDGQWSKGYVPTVIDNLTAKGEIPPMIVILIAPGGKSNDIDNRSFEYDVLSDQYSKLLLDEIIPEVAKTYNLRPGAENRGIAGASSGGICAFTTAWERPDQFSKVLSWIGSFVDLAKLHGKEQGGDDYPSLIRKNDAKPIRVFLQDGKNDLDNPFGNWPLANLEMQKALAYKGYDATFVFGNGFHSDAQGRNTLPAAMRWLWRDVK